MTNFIEIATIVEETLDQMRFRLWLEDRDNYWRATPRSGGACPLARYLDDVLPEIGESSAVSGSTVTVEPPEPGANVVEVDLPGWGRRFVTLVDVGMLPITNFGCLVLLDMAVDEEGS